MSLKLTAILSIITAIATIGDLHAQDTDTAYKVKSIVIDAGHGGKDPGALGKISQEKDLTLALALKLGHYIDSLLPGIKVIYTRDTDKFLSLKERAEFTNANNPNIFISIHINSHKSSKVSGFTTYVSGESRNEESIAIQTKENGDEEIKIEDVISAKVTHPCSHEYSILLAQKIQTAFKASKWFKTRGAKDLGCKYANFAVLWRAAMPAVLVECGYISNRSEEEYLNSKIGQVNIASAIFRGVKSYIREVESRGSKPVITTPATAPQQSASTTTQTNETAQKPGGKITSQQNNETKTPQTAKKSSDDDKVYFRVQIKSNPKKIPLTSKEFKGLKNIDELYLDGAYKYTIGKTQNYDEIVKKQSEIRKTIKDAFVIATKGNVRLKDINKAKEEISKQ